MEKSDHSVPSAPFYLSNLLKTWVLLKKTGGFKIQIRFFHEQNISTSFTTKPVSKGGDFLIWGQKKRWSFFFDAKNDVVIFLRIFLGLGLHILTYSRCMKNYVYLARPHQTLIRYVQRLWATQKNNSTSPSIYKKVGYCNLYTQG